MLSSRNLRLVVPIVRHESLQSRSHLSGVRSYSIGGQKSRIQRHLHHRPRQNNLRASHLQQTRSLSLFGWGSSRSTNPDFPKVHSTQPAGNPQSSVYETWDAGTASSNSRPIKAVESTSDTPPTSTFPHTSEPEVLRDIENAIASPHYSPGNESLLSVQEDISAIPERIGYLKEVCGLDYGWGSTALLENLVEHLHISAGLTWGASIVACAVLIRLLVFRPSCQSSNMSVRMKQANPILLPLRTEYKEATLAKDNVKQAQLAAQMRMIMQEYNITYWKLLLPILIQVPLSFGGFRLFRGMAALPVPAFEAENWLWASDLTQSDPLYILPIISAASLYMSMRLGTETGTGPMQGGLGQVLKIGLPFTSLIFIYLQPGAVQLFFCTQSVLSLCQTYLLQSAFVRSSLGLLPMPPKVVGTSGPAAIGGLRTWQDPDAGQAREAEKSARRNASVVDRYVDAAKGRYTTMKEGVLGKQEDRVATRKNDNFVSKAEKYEMTRRQQAEWERENRNRTKTAGGFDGKSGKEMIDELVEEGGDGSRTIASKRKKRQFTGTPR